MRREQKKMQRRKGQTLGVGNRDNGEAESIPQKLGPLLFRLHLLKAAVASAADATRVHRHRRAKASDDGVRLAREIATIRT